MSRSARFFRYTWRFNALVIAVVGILGVAIMTAFAFMIFSDLSRSRPDTAVVNVEDAPEISEKWNFGYMREIAGTPVFVLPLEAKQSYPLSYSGKQASATRNLLFLDTRTQAQSWLFADNSRLILSYDAVSPSGQDESTSHAVGIFYQLVERDSNDDGRLDRRDRRSLAVSSVSGAGFKRLLDDVETLIDKKPMQSGELLVLFKRNGEARSAIIDLKGGILRAETPTRDLPSIVDRVQ